jgi:acyl-coenzyme A thioesterase PaaI-like protein
MAIITETATLMEQTATDTAPIEHLHSECFACGVANSIGLNLHFDVDADGVALAVWQPSPAFRGYPGRVHGGVVATMLDSSIVHTLFARGIAGVTAEMNLRFLHPVNLHDPVTVRGWVESSRHGLYLCSAEAEQMSLIVVRASAKFLPWREEKTARHTL